jgi:hypothetical protein
VGEIDLTIAPMDSTNSQYDELSYYPQFHMEFCINGLKNIGLKATNVDPTDSSLLNLL